MYYLISISERSTDSRVDVARYGDFDQAIGFAFQLHQVSTCRHYITVRDSTSNVVASFVRVDTFTASLPSDQPSESDRKLGFRRK